MSTSIQATPPPPPPRAASPLQLELATVGVLWRRDVTRFFRQKSRVLGALAQPILFWVVIGAGFSGTFRVPGAEGLSYQQFFFPGVVAMVLLFSAIFSTITVIEDRREGFLQCVLAGPGSRWALVGGKVLGASTIALLQAGVFLAFAPAAGVRAESVSYGALALVMALTALALTGLGFALAWWINSTAGYHAVMSAVLIPMWVLSGAMFPLRGAGPILSAVMAVNPLRFAVEALRRALYGPELADAVAPGGWGGSAALELGALAAFAAVTLSLAAWRVARCE